MDTGFYRLRIIPYRTRTAVILMLFAIMFISGTHILKFLPVFTYNYFGFSTWLRTFYDYFFLVFIFLSILILIMILASVLLFNKGKLEFNEEHKKNVEHCKRIALMYIPVFSVLLVILVYGEFQANPSGLVFLSAMTNFLLILEGIILVLLIFVPVKAIAGRTERDVLFLFSFFMILAVIVVAVYDITKPYTNTYLRFGHLYLVNITISLVFILIMMFASTGYIMLLRAIQVHGDDLPSRSKGIFSRSKGISKRIEGAFKSPMRTLTAFCIIGLILGAAEGLDIRSELIQLGNEDIYQESITNPGSPQLLRGKLAYSDELSEGTTLTYDCTMDEHVMIFYAELTWNDEPNEQYRINQPDCFTMNVTLGNMSKTQTQENPDYGSGVLLIQFDLDEENAVYVQDAVVVVTLEYAGDHTGPLGLENSPSTITDNSNSYTLVIDYCCCLKDE
jgi:hypothetical protein